jgi:hypothetical protein
MFAQMFISSLVTIVVIVGIGQIIYNLGHKKNS